MLRDEAEGFVDRHVAHEGDDEDRAEGGAGKGRVSIADVAEHDGKDRGQAGADQR